VRQHLPDRQREWSFDHRVEVVRHERIGLDVPQPERVDHRRYHSYRVVTKVLEFFGIELRVGDRRRDARSQIDEFAPPELEQLGILHVPLDEESCRRDVVVHEHDRLATTQQERREIGLADGRVIHDDTAWRSVTECRERKHLAREFRRDVTREDFRRDDLSQYIAQLERGVRDCVTADGARQYLMDAEANVRHRIAISA
jgi:hypothetical protein